LDVTGAPILPASVSIGVNHKVFPSSLMLSRVKLPPAWALRFLATMAWSVCVIFTEKHYSRTTDTRAQPRPATGYKILGKPTLEELQAEWGRIDGHSAAACSETDRAFAPAPRAWRYQGRTWADCSATSAGIVVVQNWLWFSFHGVALHAEGQGFDIVFDTVGGATIDASFDAVRP
jgi:hypothetical protein